MCMSHCSTNGGYPRTTSHDGREPLLTALGTIDRTCDMIPLGSSTRVMRTKKFQR